MFKFLKKIINKGGREKDFFIVDSESPLNSEQVLLLQYVDFLLRNAKILRINVGNITILTKTDDENKHFEMKKNSEILAKFFFIQRLTFV